MAAAGPDPNLVSLLLSHGADGSCLDKKQRTPKLIASTATLPVFKTFETDGLSALSSMKFDKITDGSSSSKHKGGDSESRTPETEKEPIFGSSRQRKRERDPAKMKEKQKGADADGWTISPSDEGERVSPKLCVLTFRESKILLPKIYN